MSKYIFFGIHIILHRIVYVLCICILYYDSPFLNIYCATLLSRYNCNVGWSPKKHRECAVWNYMYISFLTSTQCLFSVLYNIFQYVCVFHKVRLLFWLENGKNYGSTQIFVYDMYVYILVRCCCCFFLYFIFILRKQDTHTQYG